MLCTAALLDLFIGSLLLLFSWIGVDDYGILDILGAMIIGLWLYFRAGSWEGFKKGIKKFLLAFGIELIPIIGNISPSWTILVYRELKNSPGPQKIEAESPNEEAKTQTPKKEKTRLGQAA